MPFSGKSTRRVLCHIYIKVYFVCVHPYACVYNYIVFIVCENIKWSVLCSLLLDMPPFPQRTYLRLMVGAGYWVRWVGSLDPPIYSSTIKVFTYFTKY